MTLNDAGVWIGITGGAVAIVTALFALLWKIFRIVEQGADTAALAIAGTQAQALVDKRLVGIEAELSSNGGSSLKDDVKAIRASLPEIIAANNEARDASFLDLAGPYVRRFEKYDTRLTVLEAGHVEINEKLDQLIDNMKETP